MNFAPYRRTRIVYSLPWGHPETQAARYAGYEATLLGDDRFTIDFALLFPIIAIAGMAWLTAIAGLQLLGGNLYRIATQILYIPMFGALLIVFILGITIAYDGKVGYRFVFAEGGMDGVMTFTVMLLTFGAARFAAAAASITVSKIFGNSSIGLVPLGQVFISSAVFEEVLFTLGLDTGMYLLFVALINSVIHDPLISRFFSMLITTALSSYMFMELHLGVYGTDPSALVYVAVSRACYTFSYLLTKKAVIPFGAHFLNNLTLSILVIP